MKEWVSLIPNTVHLIWIGDQEYPDYFKLFLKSYELHMPEFTVKVWGNKELTKKNFPLTYDYIKKAKKIHGTLMYDEDSGKQLYKEEGKNLVPMKHSKWAQITDLMRLEIIYNHGGYYFDTTFEILQPLYTLFNKKHYKFVGCNEVPRFKNFPALTNAFFGAVKKSVILKRLLTKKSLSNIDFTSYRIEDETGPEYLRSAIKESDKGVKIFPTTYFYPFIEPVDSYNDSPFRKSSLNKCHKKTLRKSKKSQKSQRSQKSQKYKKLNSNKGYILYPCKNYPKSYALKHWQLGGSWYWWNSFILDDDDY